MARTLPLLDALYEEKEHQAGCLTGWGCIYVQHVLSSTVACAYFLERMGLARDCLRIVGKAYSTSEAAYREYLENGFKVSDAGRDYAYSEPFDAALIRQARNDALELLEAGITRLLLVDEGGISVRGLASLRDRFEHLAVVELTARGAQQFHLIDKAVPIVDVARSATKKKIEAPLIAESMIGMLAAEVRRSAGTPLDRLRVGLVGAGAIGSAVVQQLQQRGVQARRFDADATRSDVRELKDLLDGCDLILSSTGDGNGFEHYRSPQQRLFCNCGSSDVEFKLWQARTKGAGFRVGDVSAPWRETLEVIADATAPMHYLRGGFPINFDGSPDPIPAEKIQITRGILMAGAIQAVMSREAGVQMLEEGIQCRLRTLYGAEELS